jgi:hypothetical protein
MSGRRISARFWPPSRRRTRQPSRVFRGQETARPNSGGNLPYQRVLAKKARTASLNASFRSPATM